MKYIIFAVFLLCTGCSNDSPTEPEETIAGRITQSFDLIQTDNIPCLDSEAQRICIVLGFDGADGSICLLGSMIRVTCYKDD